MIGVKDRKKRNQIVKISKQELLFSINSRRHTAKITASKNAGLIILGRHFARELPFFLNLNDFIKENCSNFKVISK